MPRTRTPSELLLERLSALERQVPNLSHLILLLRKCYLTRVHNKRFLMPELAFPVFGIIFVVIFCLLARHSKLPMVDPNQVYTLNADHFKGTPFLVQKADSITENLLPVEMTTNLIQKMCRLGPFTVVDHLRSSIFQLFQNETANKTVVGLHLQWLPKKSNFSRDNPNENRHEIHLRLYVPFFAQSTGQFLYHGPFPFDYDPIKNFQFGYTKTGFIVLQRCVLNAVRSTLLLNQAAASSNASSSTAIDMNWDEKIKLQPMFTHEWESSFGNIFDWPLAQGIAIGFLLSSLNMGDQIIFEKRSNTRDLMRVLGVRTGIYWASHFLFNFVTMMLQSLVVVAVLEVLFLAHPSDKANLISWSADGVLHSLKFLFERPAFNTLLLIMSCYSLMQCTFCCLCSVVWRRKRTYDIFLIIVTLTSVHIPRLLLDSHYNLLYREPEYSTRTQARTRFGISQVVLEMSLWNPNTCLQMAMQLVHELDTTSSGNSTLSSLTVTSYRMNDIVLSEFSSIECVSEVQCSIVD